MHNLCICCGIYRYHSHHFYCYKYVLLTCHSQSCHHCHHCERPLPLSHLLHCHCCCHCHCLRCSHYSIAIVTISAIVTNNIVTAAAVPIIPTIRHSEQKCHYGDVIMGTIASQITGVSMVSSTVCSGADQRKQQSSASLAFMRGIHWWPMNSPHKGPVTRKMFPLDDVIMVHNPVLHDTLWDMG